MKRNMFFYLLIVFLFIVSSFIGSSGARAQTDIPREVASKVFLKVLKFDRTFQSADDPGVLVMHNEDDADGAGFYADKFRGAGYRSQTVSIESLSDQVSRFQVLMIASPGTESGVYDELTRANDVLTISLDPSKVEEGSSSIGVKLIEEKPELLFNLQRLNQEGHDIPSKVLKLGTVYGQ